MASKSTRKGPTRRKSNTRRRKKSAAAPDIDLEIEIVGTLLWSEFSRGAHPYSFGRDIVMEGRTRAEPNLRKNITNGTFDLAVTLGCAFDCGREAKRLSGSTTTVVTLEAFKDAWDGIRDFRFAALARLVRMQKRKGVPPPVDQADQVGGACG